MKLLILLTALIAMPWLTSEAFADCYIMNMGGGDRLHNCDSRKYSGVELGIGNEDGDGFLLRFDGRIDKILGMGDGFAYILRYNGRVDEVIGIGGQDGLIIDDPVTAGEMIGFERPPLETI